VFVCPNCNYRDESCWKAHRYMLYVVYCRIDKLQACNPVVAQLLFDARDERIVARESIGPNRRKTPLGGADIEYGPYAYHLTKSGYVLRAPKELKEFMYRRDLIERYRRKDPLQKKLEVLP